MAGGNNVEVHINGDEDVSGAAARAAAAIDALEGKKITVDIDFDTKDAEKTLRSLKDEAKTIGDSVGDFDLNTRKARDKLTYLHERAKALGDLDTEIDVDTRKARDKLTYLHNRHKELGDNKPDVDVDTTKARDKFTYLKSRFSEIFADKPEVDVDTKKARDKLSKLGSRVKEVISVKQEIDIDTDKAKEKLNGLNKIGKKLKKINIDVDIDDAVDQIEDLYLAMEHLKDKTINIDIDSGQALAQMAALDSALHGIDGRKNVEIDFDVNDIDIMRWQSELDALNRNKRRLENDPYNLIIPAEVEVDEDRIKELEKRIADKKNTIKVKTELDNSELEDAGIKDKTVKIGVEINGLERLQALRAVIASLEDKTININVNSNFKDIDKLTNSRNGVARPIVQTVGIKYDSSDYDKLNRIMQQGIKDMNTRNNKRANDFLINNIDNAAALLADRMKAYKSIDKNNSLKFDNIAPQKIRVLVDDSEVKRYQQAIDALEKDKQFIGPEIEGRRLGQLTKMRQELERLETLGKSSLTPQTGKNGLVDLGRQRAKLRKQISEFEKDFNNNPVQIAAELAINERRIKDLTDKLANRQKQLGEPFKNINIDDTALKNAKKNLKNTDIKIRAILDRDNAIKDLKNQKAEIEKTPIKLRTESDNNAIKNITKDLKNLENIKRRSASLDSRLADKNRYQAEIKSIKAVRTALNDANNLKLKDVRIKAQADTTAAAAKFDALTRPRELDVRINERRFQTITRVFNDIGDSADRAGRRLKNTFGNDDSGFIRGLSTIGRFSDGVNRGIGKMTSRIPLVGSLFTGLSNLGGSVGGLTTKLSGMAGAGPKAAGAIGGIAQSVVSLGSALLGLGVVGVVGTGAITAGAYVAQAALGTVATVVGAVGAAIGGLAIGGFAYLVKDVPVVQEAYSKLGETVGNTMKQLATPVAIPLANAAPKLQAAFDQISPTISRIASQTGGLVNELGDKLPAVAKEVGPALQKAFDFGDSSLNSLMNNLPAITKSVGEFFGKMDGPEVRKAVNGAFAALPGVIGAVGTGLEKASAGFNNIQEFMGSSKLDPMREGFEKFSQSLSNTDWSSATNGITSAMNAFGNFAGNIDMQNISDGIGGFAEGLANLTDVADKANLDGIFSALGTGFSGFTKLAEGAGTALSRAFAPIAQGVENAFSVGSWIKDNILGGNETVNVDGPNIELNPNISVADAKQAEIAKGILDNVDGKSFGSADAAERIISSLNNDIEKLEVKPEVKGILDQNTIAKNVNSENIGKLLQNRIGEDQEPVKIPIQTAMDIETAAGKDGLNVQDSIKDQLSKLTGIAVEDLNIEVGVGTTFKVAKNADGSLGDLIKGSIDDQGNLSIEVVATANVVAQIAGVTGLDGAALDSALGGIFDGQTISQDLAIQIKANMGLADASMADFESALEGKLAGINGQNYDVILNADGTVNITIKDPAIPAIPPPPPLPDLTMQQKAVVALQFDMKYTEFGALTEQLKSLGAQGGESIEITKEMQVNLEAVVGGGTEAEVQQKIKELISGLTNIPVEQLDILFEGKAQFNLLGNPAAEIANAVKSSAASAESAKTTVTPEIDVQPQVNFDGSKIAAGIATGMKSTAASAESAKTVVTPQIDVSGIAQQLGAISVPPIKVLVQPDLTGFAAIMGAIGGSSVGIVKVLVQPDLSGFGAILGAINGSTIGTVRVLVVPDLSAMGALGAIVIPPIRVPIIIDPPIIPSIVVPPIRVPMLIDPPIVPQIAVPMLRGTITYDAIIPPINIPNTSSTHTIVINNPGLPSFPNTTSTHTIIMNVPAMPSFPNTSSTHTINVVQVGSAVPRSSGAKAASGARSIPNNAMGAMSMGGVSALSSTAMGAPVGIGPAVSRGTVGLGLAIGGLAIGGLLLGLGALFAGLFAILGAFSNNIGKLKPNDIDGGSYRPEGVINHYYYQTTQNNHFDGGLVGDPELQGKRVLEVLQSAPNGRQFRQQLGAST